eukprot:jgi/Mesvir1/8067/Mv25220-RA.1
MSVPLGPSATRGRVSAMVCRHGSSAEGCEGRPDEVGRTCPSAGRGIDDPAGAGRGRGSRETRKVGSGGSKETWKVVSSWPASVGGPEGATTGGSPPAGCSVLAGAAPVISDRGRRDSRSNSTADPHVRSQCRSAGRRGGAW